MTADPPEEFPDFAGALPDESAMRKAVLRGVLRTGFAAASWLLVLVLVLIGIGWTIEGVRGDTFKVARRGLEVAYPQYEIAQDGPCCSDGLTSPGTSTLTLRLHARGSVGPSPDTGGTVHRGLTGDLTVDVGEPDATPIGRALYRGRLEKAATRRFLDSLPKSLTTSAVVEFTKPLDQAGFDAYVGERETPAVLGPIFLRALYQNGAIVSWPHPGVDEYRAWVKQLDSTDDDDTDDLAALGLPPAADLRAAASSGRIHGYVLDRATVEELGAMLADPRVRSINVADVGFDPDRQQLPN